LKQKKLAFLKTIIFVVGFIVLSLCVFLLPILARDAAVMNPEYAYLKLPVLLSLYVTAIPFFIALYQTLRLLNYIECKNAFSKVAVNSLGYIKNCAFSIITLYVIGMLSLVILNALHPGIAIIGIVIIFSTLVISFFAKVLQEILSHVITLQSENDLTV
jgi:hypothetical protein